MTLIAILANGNLIDDIVGNYTDYTADNDNDDDDSKHSAS